MPRAKIVVREKDPDTESYAVLDMIHIEIPKDEKETRKLIGATLLRFFMDIHNKHSDITDIHIELER